MDLKVGNVIAVHSIEEPFFLAKVVNTSNRHKLKIKWLDKIGTTRDGTKYSLSYDDTIQEHSIICKINLVKLSRFTLLLSNKEEKRILSMLKSEKESDADDEDGSTEINDITDGRINNNNLKKNDDNINSLIDTANIISKIYFNETETISNKCLPDISNNQRSELLGECETFTFGSKAEEVKAEEVKVETKNQESLFNKGDMIESPNIFLKNDMHFKLGDESREGKVTNEFDKTGAEIIETQNNISNNKNVFEEHYCNPEEILVNNTGNDQSKITFSGEEDYFEENSKREETLLEVVNEATNVQNTVKFSGKDEKNSKSVDEEQSKEYYDQEIFSSKTDNYEPDNKFEEANVEEAKENSAAIENFEQPENTNKINVISNVVIKLSNNSKKYEELSDSTPTPPFVDSGSEYIPSSEESDIEMPLVKNITVSEGTFSNMTCENELTSRLTIEHKKESLSSDSSDETDKGIVLKPCKKTDRGGRIYDKRHVCYFCYKLLGKMARHLAIVHSNELEIARLLALPEKSIERKEGFLCILRAGDYYHNVEVLTTKSGELILSRRASNVNNTSYRKYGPCPNCLGFFLTSNLWHHIKYNCPKKSSLDVSVKDKNVSRRDIRGESLALLGQSLGVSQEYQKYILGNFKNDEIGELCRQDEIIIKFGSMLYEKYTAQQHEHIRQTMRQLSRLLMEVKKLDSGIKSLQDVMLPKNFDILIAAVQQLCVSGRNDVHSRVYGIPSLALKIGHSLRKCSLIVRGIALRKGDLTTNREMESFLDLMTLEWNAKVSTAALRTLKEKQMNATQLLPITSDIVKLNVYLDITITQLLADKNLMLSSANWQKLAQATLSRIVLFNKRRSGEAARMTLNQYAIRPNWSEQCTSELKESLTDLENNLANNLTVVEVIGKSRKNFKVPILLTHQTKAAIDKLIETREQVGIARSNIYVFARGSGSTRPLRGHDCLRKFAKDACLEQPSSVTSTKLRKYIATVVQILNLKHNEYDWLARHLGHDIAIHREFYRLHESAVELTKISRLLLAIDKGQINKFKGKSLDEINVAELPDLDSEPENFISDEENETISDEDTEIDSLEKEMTVNTSKQKLWLSDKNDLPKKKMKLKDEPSTSGLRKTVPKRKPWSKEEKEILLKYFRSSIRHNIVPRKEDAEKCISENKPNLDNRCWRDVKNWVYNKIKSAKLKKIN